MWMAYHVGYDVTWNHVNGTRSKSMTSHVTFSKCPEMLKTMHFLPTALSRNSCTILILQRPFPICLLPLFQSESPCKSFFTKMSFICMKINLHVRLNVIWMVLHENLFSHWGREYSEMVYFVKKLGKKWAIMSRKLKFGHTCIWLCGCHDKVETCGHSTKYQIFGEGWMESSWKFQHHRVSLLLIILTTLSPTLQGFIEFLVFFFSWRQNYKLAISS